MSFHQPQPQQTGLRPIGESLGAVIVGLDRVMAKKAGKSIIQNLADAGGWAAPEPDTERYRMLEAALASRGMPYRFGGGEGGHDAWSLVRQSAIYATGRDGIAVERGELAWGIEETEARKVLTQWGLTEVKLRHAAPGDVLLFDMGGAIHAAIMSAPGGELSWAMDPGKALPEAKIIHASPCKAVVESWAGSYWTDKLFAAFSFDSPAAPVRAALKVAA